MDKDLQKIRKLINFARKQGLKSLKAGDIEFEFSGSPEPKRRKPLVMGEPLSSDIEMPGDDEMLYASTPYFDHLLAERKNPNAKERQ